MRSTGTLQSLGLTVDACKQYITISTWIGNVRYHYRIDENSEIYISGRRLEFQNGRGRYDTIQDLYTILKLNDVYKDFVFQVDSLDGPYGEPPRCYNYCKKCQFVISDELLGDYFVKFGYDRIIMSRKMWITSAPSNRYDYSAMRKRYSDSLHGMGCCVPLGYLDTDIIEMARKARKQWLIEDPAQTAYVFGPKYPAINKVIFNAPATIVMWSDGDKTIVKCQDGDKFDPEKGLAMACMKKLLGTNKTGSNYLDVVKGYISKYEAEEGKRVEKLVENHSENATRTSYAKKKDDLSKHLERRLGSAIRHLPTIQRAIKNGMSDEEIEKLFAILEKYDESDIMSDE